MTVAAPQTNPYLAGNFAPIRNETDAENLSVVGKIPDELNGMFVRNGPDPQFPPIGQYHWFDGDGMLHAVHFQDGRATYRNRYVRTSGFVKERDAGAAIWSGILEPPQMELPEGPTKNVANTALVWHAGKFLALWEGGSPHRIQLPGLETLGTETFDGKLPSAFTAHPKVDPRTGELFFFGYAFSAPPYLQYSIVSADGTLQRSLPIDLPVPVMMHDFAITERYAIFPDFPFTFRPERAQRGEPVTMFERDRPSRFGILPRYGNADEIRWFEADSCYAFHVLNAYEVGNEVVVLACRNRAFDLGGTENGKINATENAEDSTPYLHEWRFDLASGTSRESRVASIPCEFPRINEAYTGRPMRYGYAGRVAPSPMPLFDAAIAFDFSESTGVRTQIHELGSDRYCGELVFAPRPDATAENDGWLLTFVHDESANQSELLILDAQNLDGEPVARVLLPQRVPYGFHATWVDAERVAATV